MATRERPSWKQRAMKRVRDILSSLPADATYREKKMALRPHAPGQYAPATERQAWRAAVRLVLSPPAQAIATMKLRLFGIRCWLATSDNLPQNRILVLTWLPPAPESNDCRPPFRVPIIRKVQGCSLYTGVDRAGVASTAVPHFVPLHTGVDRRPLSFSTLSAALFPCTQGWTAYQLTLPQNAVVVPLHAGAGYFLLSRTHQRR